MRSVSQQSCQPVLVIPAMHLSATAKLIRFCKTSRASVAEYALSIYVALDASTGCSCLREIECVAALPAHPHIVGQYRAWQQHGHFYIQMELCEGGTLAAQLKEVKRELHCA